LSPAEFRRIAEWFRERGDKQWDEQLDRDSGAGKLDFLFKEAEDEANKGSSRLAGPL
jgi:hypothetical protein